MQLIYQTVPAPATSTTAEIVAVLDELLGQTPHGWSLDGPRVPNIRQPQLSR